MATPSTPRVTTQGPDLPEISDDDEFGVLTRKLSFYFVEAITLPSTFEELRRLSTGRILSPLILYLSDSVHHPAVVSALLALKGYFAAHEETSDEPGVNEARGYACEFVAWKFLTNLKEREIIDLLLYELPPKPSPSNLSDPENGSYTHQNGHNTGNQSHERAPLLTSIRGDYFGTESVHDGTAAADARSAEFASQFENLSALEIAIVSNAKKFLKQRAVQRVINGLWRGDIVFWETLSVNSVKRPMLYNRRRADLFCRLRVPRYLKIFETLYFAIFLALYYAVLVHRSEKRVTALEILLYIWIAGFAYDEFGDFHDAGQVSFYASDFWWTWDISIVFVGVAFCTLRIIGLRTGSQDITDLAYDVLGLEALFLVPRIFSLLSLNPYFGTLIPCLKEMTKDFVKFLSLVLILYLGFLTTFVLLGRDKFKPQEMSWILIKVFFGSSYLGFDIANEISPFFGPPVMLVFVALTNILLITSLISLLSNSLSKVLDHARDEYLFIYSVYVLEASSSNRLTYFFPPLNLIPLFLRPLRLILPSERLRSARIVLLKATHIPFIGVIWVLEQLADARKRSSGIESIHGPETPTALRRPIKVFITSPGPLTAGRAAEIQAGSEGNSSTAGGTYQASRPHERIEDPHASEPQLKSLVLKLTAQVEELTAMVSQLQEEREASTAA